MRLLLWGLLQREQLVRPEVALIVARPVTRKNRLGVILDFARRVGVAHAEKHTALPPNPPKAFYRRGSPQAWPRRCSRRKRRRRSCRCRLVSRARRRGPARPLPLPRPEPGWRAASRLRQRRRSAPGMHLRALRGRAATSSAATAERPSRRRTTGFRPP